MPPRSFRWLLIVWGGTLFVWVSLEDTSTMTVAILGAGTALLAGVRQALKSFGGRPLPGGAALLGAALLGAALLGATVGVGGAVCASALMFIKTAAHAHAFPDYPPTQIIAMLGRAPVWGVAGALAGCGLLLAWAALMWDTTNERHPSR
jgi:hypothetical protein